MGIIDRAEELKHNRDIEAKTERNDTYGRDLYHRAPES